MKRLPRLLTLFLLAISVLTALSYATTWVLIHLSHETAFPYSATFLPADRYLLDITCFRDRFQFFHQNQFFGVYEHPFNYPPTVAVAYRVFYQQGFHAARWYLLVMLVCFLIAVVLFARALIRRGLSPGRAIGFTALSAGLSYPFAIAFLLGNMEIVVWALLASGVWLFLKGYGWQAAVLFGLAASMKYFPMVYLALPLAQKRYRDALLVPVVCVASLLASAWYVGPTMSAVYLGVQKQTQIFQSFYLNEFHLLENSIDHSLFGLAKYWMYNTHQLASLPGFTPIYLAIVAVTGIAAWLLRIRKLPVTNQVLALSVASVLLPPVSHDYTLMHLYAPWAMLVLMCLTVRRRGMGLAFVCMSLLFTPQSFLIHHTVRFAGQFKAVVLVVLFIVALWFPFEDEVPLVRSSPGLSPAGEPAL